MASENDPEREAGGSPEPDIVQRLDAIDGSLLDHIENDARLQSGVPAGQRPTDLDFIQMSGLARPGNQARPHSDEVVSSAEEPDLDTSKPLSFFERGITDVDSDMAPQAPDHIEDPEHIVVAGSTPLRPDPLDEYDAFSSASASGAHMPHESDREEAEAAASEFASSQTNESEDAGDFDTHSTTNAPELRIAHAPDLEEAEQLLQALESQPREFPVPTRETAPPLPQTIASPVSLAATAVSVPIAAATPPAHAPLPVTMNANAPQSFSANTDEKLTDGYDYPLAIDLDPEKAEEAKDPDGEERDASVYNKPMPGKHTRRAKGSSSHTWRRLFRLIIRVVLVVVMIGIIALVITHFRQQAQPSMQAFELAQQTKSEGKFREASEAFKEFAATHPEDPLKAEAEFQAAFCMQQTPTSTTPFDEQKDCKTKALDLYKQFITDNPAHEKTMRAKVIIGLLSVDLGLYPEGIEILQNPDLLLADPDSALPALRALAVARLKVGNRDAAASAYLQAMALSRNYTPENDLEALANIYSDQAREAGNEEERKRLLKQAVDRLNDAVRLPTVDPSVRNTLQTKRDYILKELGEPIPENEGNQPAPAAPGGTPELQLPANAPAETTPNAAPDAAPPEAPVAPTVSTPAEPATVEPAPADPAATTPAEAAPATPVEPAATLPAPAAATPDPHMETEYPNTAK